MQSALGIDLGTSNCALALANKEKEPVDSIDIFQITAEGQGQARRGMPSALYIPSPGQFSPEALSLPWESGQPTATHIIGQFAREIGAQSPERLVHSAKSWLCNAQIDPTRAVLPWNSEIPEPKISPLQASTLYLRHLRQAFLHACPEAGSPDQAKNTPQIVLTVPASFDEAARSLTARAASEAGWGKDVLLLEEPQAAFYAWLDRVGTGWRDAVRPGDCLLVCDVGGGTTDFSLIAVGQEEGNLTLERLCVGAHILLGGDNMDLALAYALRAQLEGDGKNLDDWQFLALIQAAGRAKIALFENPAKASEPIALPSRGSGLFAGTISTELPRSLLDAIILEGFFARTAPDDAPSEGDALGLQEFGLPYAADAVIPKHLALFLQRAMSSVKAREDLQKIFRDRPEKLNGERFVPDAVLFNGGVFRAAPLRQRVLEILSSWNPRQDPPKELEGADYDLAVARGAARYGMTLKSGKGLRIRAGAARSYYVGLASSMPAIPGFKPPVKALCVVPQGMEEGTEAILQEREFGLLTGTTARFRFFSSTARAADQPGTLIPDAEKLLQETHALELELPTLQDLPPRTTIPVKLHARLNELGTLELWMQHTRSEQRWKLDFSVRTE